MKIFSLLPLFLLACSNTVEGVAEDASKAKDIAKDVGATTKEVAREVAEVTTETAVNATEKVVEGAASAAQQVDATAQAVDVKTSLMADTTIDSTDVRVEGDNAGKVIYLRGSVPTPDQRQAAERVAKIKAAGYRVINELTVRPK